MKWRAGAVGSGLFAAFGLSMSLVPRWGAARRERGGAVHPGVIAKPGAPRKPCCNAPRRARRAGSPGRVGMQSLPRHDPYGRLEVGTIVPLVELLLELVVEAVLEPPGLCAGGGGGN